MKIQAFVEEIFAKQYWSLIKKLLLQDVSHFSQGVWDWYSKQEMELFRQEMELFYVLPGLCSKNFFYNILSISTKEFKIDFEKWELELFKHEMELFLPLSGLWSKNFFYKMFHIFPKEFEIDIHMWTFCRIST